MRSSFWDFILITSLCAVPFTILCTILGEHVLDVSRRYLNRRRWSDDPLPPLSQDRLAIAVFGEGLGAFMGAATTTITLIVLHEAPVPRGEWQLIPGLAVGFASATSSCAILLSNAFDISYQKAFVLQIAFLLLVTGYSVLIVAGSLLLFGTVAGLMLLIAAMFGG